jgi:hypothetical protein
MSKRTRLFLDVDGVLIGRPSVEAGAATHQLANHAIRFLEYILAEFDVSWATTQCRDGDPTHVVRYIGEHAQADECERVMELVRQIRPTSFNVCKTDIFPTESEPAWIWLDDSPMAFELNQLRKHGQIDRWLDANTVKRPDDLLRVIEVLQDLAH